MTKENRESKINISERESAHNKPDAIVKDLAPSMRNLILSPRKFEESILFSEGAHRKWYRVVQGLQEYILPQLVAEHPYDNGFHSRKDANLKG